MVDVSVSLMVPRRLVVAANLAYAAALLILGLMPSVPGAASQIPDHIAHAAAYAVQAMLVFALFLRSCGRGRAALLAIGAAVLYGGCVELLQYFQPARTVEAADLAANAVGAATSSAFLYLATGTRGTDHGR